VGVGDGGIGDAGEVRAVQRVRILAARDNKGNVWKKERGRRRKVNHAITKTHVI
jgi:hypothetical protein